MRSPADGDAAVIFTVPERRLREMVVERGPCVPVAGRKRALASVHSQNYGELPDQTAALFPALTGRPPDDVLLVVEERDGGCLMRFSPAFVDAMADASEALVRLGEEDDARKDKELSSFVAKRQEYDRAWMAAADWPSSQASTWNKLTRLGTAMVARRKCQPLFAWYGPAVPEYVVVSGQGPSPRRD